MLTQLNGIYLTGESWAENIFFQVPCKYPELEINQTHKQIQQTHKLSNRHRHTTSTETQSYTKTQIYTQANTQTNT